MKKNINLMPRKWQVATATLFLALFPGFFFYHTLLGMGYISPVLGGFFGPVSVIAFPVMIYIYINNILKYKSKLSAIDIVFLLLMAFSVIVSVVNFADGRLALGDTKMLIWSLFGVLFNFIMYILSRSVPIDSTKFRKCIYFSLFGMFLIAVLNVGDTGTFYLQEDSPYKEVVATYQGFARSIAVIALVAIALVDGLLIFAISVFIGVLTLFFNGARTELVCFIFSTIILAFTRYGILKILFLSAGFMLSITLAVYGLSAEKYEKFVGNNRNLQLFDLDNATSAQERNYLHEFAIRTIWENPILGDYASYLNIEGTSDIGSVAHNILSAWVNLGILGFIGYISITLLIVFSIIKNWKKVRAGDIEWNLVVAFSSFSIVAMIFGKDYTYMIFGLAVGFCARAISSKNYRPWSIYK